MIGQVFKAYDFNPDHFNGKPTHFISFDNRLFMTATKFGDGTELGWFDGITNGGIITILPGTDNGKADANRDQMAVLNGKLYFAGKPNGSNYVLMSYDGSSAPVPVSTYITGEFGLNPDELTSIDGKLYYRATAPGDGNELFVFDGTNSPQIINIDTPDYMGGSNPRYMTSFNGKIYFNAYEYNTGNTLFAYDPANGVVAAASNPLTGPSEVRDLINYNGGLYFAAYNLSYGVELYKYNGISASRVTDIAAGPTSSVTSEIVEYNNKLYFSATDGMHQALYSYDPTSNTTTIAHNISAGNIYALRGLAKFNGNLYFSAHTDAEDYELWVYDGINATMVTDLNPGDIGGVSSTKYVWNNKLYFCGCDSTVGLGAVNCELFTLSAANSVKNISFDGEATISPNPTSENSTLELFLNNSQDIAVNVTDILGRTIYEKPLASYLQGTSKIIIPISNQPVGLYFYKLINRHSIILATGKIQKQ